MGLEARASQPGEADPVSVGAAIRLLRKRAGMSARALSAAAGLSPAYVNKVESGKVDPSFRAFAKIAVQLRMTQREIHALVVTESKRW